MNELAIARALHVIGVVIWIGGVSMAIVRRRKIWDYGWCEIREGLAHLIMMFRRRAADEASVVSGW